MAASTEFKSKSLLKAESAFTNWTHQFPKDKSISNVGMIRKLCKTLNNWATFYQKQGDFHKSLACHLKLSKLLERAPKGDPDFALISAKTRYNFSALYMQQKKFFEALKQSKRALESLNVAYKLVKSTGSNKKIQEVMTTFISVHYSIGFCEGATGNLDRMHESYSKALEIADKHFKGEHFMVDVIQKASSEANTSRSMLNKSSQKSKREILVSPSSREFQSLEQPGLVLNRYYSSEELEKLQKTLNEPDSLQFVSADEYFYSKISKVLNLEDDVKFIKHNADKNLISLTRKDDRDKQKISELRLRRHCRHIKLQDKGPDYIKDRLSHIELQEEANSKKMEIQMKSKLKSSTYRKLNETLKKPIATERVRRRTRFTDRSQLTQSAKDGIEGLMDKLTQEIKIIDLCQRGGTAKQFHRKKKTCLLAKSAAERHTSYNSQQSIIRNSLLAALKGKNLFHVIS